MPWQYLRRLIAERWHVPPWWVDEAPVQEVQAELAIMRAEGKAAKS